MSHLYYNKYFESQFYLLYNLPFKLNFIASWEQSFIG